ncbi:hypothetical protein [Zhihengliuella sp. ISTPL4]|uniref:hypothetical protein n=1 Tax=Zhihengliuella sp. ISTPL4 TaxID=2058657 RepID=UPI000C7B97D0|nr:hypothetical protein [Zhihengliuella sp. ISTPL4]
MTDDEPNPWAQIVGPCYTTASMARTLECTETEVMEAGNDLRLLMLHTSDDVYLFPALQIQDANIVEGLQEVLRVLETGTASRWTWAQWLNVELPEEHPPRNITLLYEGRVNEALRVARHVAWAWSN